MLRDIGHRAARYPGTAVPHPDRWSGECVPAVVTPASSSGLAPLSRRSMPACGAAGAADSCGAWSASVCRVARRWGPRARVAGRRRRSAAGSGPDAGHRRGGRVDHAAAELRDGGRPSCLVSAAGSYRPRRIPDRSHSCQRSRGMPGLGRALTARGQSVEVDRRRASRRRSRPRSRRAPWRGIAESTVMHDQRVAALAVAADLHAGDVDVAPRRACGRRCRRRRAGRRSGRTPCARSARSRCRSRRPRRASRRAGAR